MLAKGDTQQAAQPSHKIGEVCGVCLSAYHTHDCGNRYRAGGLVDPALILLCPRCAGHCACGGGPVQCYTFARYASG